MTVTEIIEITGLKRGTIDQYRIIMQEYELINNNQSIDNRAVNTLITANSYRGLNGGTWEHCMRKAILNEYESEVKINFYWTNKVILNNLIWLIQNSEVKVDKVDDTNNSRDFNDIYCVIIDNFVELGKKINHYDISRGTDGNPMLTYKVYGNDYIYYIIGKYNGYTENEDVHVFYNEGLEFNVMKCKHVLGGSSESELLKSLMEVCMNNI